MINQGHATKTNGRLAREATYSRLAAQGMTAQQIADETGVTSTPVYVWAKREGVLLAAPGARVAMSALAVARRAEEFTRLASMGRSAAQIANEVGVAPFTVYGWARREGVVLATNRGGLPVSDLALAARRAEFARLAEAGNTAVQIAQLVDCCVQTVQIWARGAGVVLVRADGLRVSTTDADVAARHALLMQMHMDGKNMAEVGAALGLSQPAVLGWAQRAGVALARPNGHAARSRIAVTQRNADFRRLAEEGNTTAKIAEIVGVSRSTVQSWAKRNNVDLPVPNGVSRKVPAKLAREAEYQRLADLNQSAATIAATVGVSVSIVRAWASREGVEIGRGNTALTTESGAVFYGWEPGSFAFRNHEDPFRDLLARQLGGITEATLALGRADVLTADRVIEVEPVEVWRHGAFQAAAYSGLTGLSSVLAIVGAATSVKVEAIRVELAASGIALMWWDGSTWVDIRSSDGVRQMPDPHPFWVSPKEAERLGQWDSASVA